MSAWHWFQGLSWSAATLVLCIPFSLFLWLCTYAYDRKPHHRDILDPPSKDCARNGTEAVTR